jgi:hypothetical protein
VRIIDPWFHRRVSARVKFDPDVFADPLVFAGAIAGKSRKFPKPFRFNVC